MNLLEMLSNDLEKIEPEQRVGIILKLMEFIYPKRKAIEIDDHRKEGQNKGDLSLLNSEELKAYRNIVMKMTGVCEVEKAS